jgi:hypothetical protein
MKTFINQSIRTSFLAFIVLFLISCINDDFINDTVEPELRITSTIQELGVGDQFQFEKVYLNNIGQEEIVDFFWTSSDPSILSITESGLATAITAGDVQVSVTTIIEGSQLTETVPVTVGQETIASASFITGVIETTTFYDLEGTFTLSQDGEDLFLEIDENYLATSALPGFYVYLSNNRNSIAGAKEISEVTVFQGAHNYTIPDTGLNEYAFIVYYCKPFNVKVGEAVLAE